MKTHLHVRDLSTPSRVLRGALGVTLCLIATQGAGAPYQAHPQKSFTTVEWNQAQVILGEALHRIADVYDRLGSEDRYYLRVKLASRPDVRTLAGLQQLSLREAQDKLQMAMGVWKASFPALSADSGEQAGISFPRKVLLQLAHGLLRLSYQVAKIPSPTNASEVIDRTIFGPSLDYQTGKIRSSILGLNNLCERQCQAPPRDFKASDLPKAYTWIKTLIAVAPDELVSLGERALGPDKTCSSLAHDVLEIVGPHSSPLRGTSGKPGQIEALSGSVAKRVLQGLEKGSNSRLLTALLSLRKLDHLNADLEIEEALEQAIPLALLPVEKYQLLSLASHNHGVELYLQKGALELVRDRDAAVSLADSISDSLNHFYGLLNAHHNVRKATDTSVFGRAARPYHSWGGSLVACELVTKGYSAWSAVLVSSALGKIYEDWTSQMGAGSKSDALVESAEDIQLHRLGALKGVLRCVPSRQATPSQMNER